MGRDTLGLAFDSLFIEKNRNAFKAAYADLLTKVYDFSKEKSSGLGTEFFQATELLFDQDADEITIVGVLLAPLVWRGLAHPDEIRKHFDDHIGLAKYNGYKSLYACVYSVSKILNKHIEF
jgi:hypothetical protein